MKEFRFKVGDFLTNQDGGQYLWIVREVDNTQRVGPYKIECLRSPEPGKHLGSHWTQATNCRIDELAMNQQAIKTALKVNNG